MSARMHAQRGDFIVSNDDAYCWDTFGLERNPFQLLPGSNAYYPFHQWEEYLDLLQQLSRNNNVLLSVVGPRGAGKTTLMHQFLVQTVHGFDSSEISTYSKLAPGEFWVLIEEKLRTCQVRADTSLDVERLVDLITEGFDLSWQGGSSLQEQLDAQIENLQRSKQTCLLLIDEAHLLPSETIQTLLYIINQQSESEMRFHVLLFGDSGLKNQINKVADSRQMSDITCVLELKPLNREETECYLQHCFREAGLKGTMPLSHAQIQRIYKQSKGIPGQINQVAQHLLLSTTKRKPHAPLLEWIQEHTPLVGGSGLFVATAIFLSIFINNNSGNSEWNREKSIAHLPANTFNDSSTAPVGALSNALPSRPVAHVPYTQPVTTRNGQAPQVQLTVASESRMPADLPAAVPLSASINSAEQTVLAPTTSKNKELVTLPQVKQPPQIEPQLSLTKTQIASLQAKIANEEGVQAPRIQSAEISPASAPMPVLTASVSSTGSNTPPVIKTSAVNLKVSNSNAVPNSVASASILVPAKSEGSIIVISENTAQPGKPLTAEVTSVSSLDRALSDTQKNPSSAAINATKGAPAIVTSANVITVTKKPVASLSANSAITMPANSSAGGSKSTLNTDSSHSAIKSTANAKLASKSEKANKSAPTATHGLSNKQLLSANPQSFTLQLVGVSHEDALIKLMREQSLGSKASYFHTYHDGKDWYVLVYGVYPTQQDAMIAKGNLPPAIQNLKPWVRKMTNVQQAIKTDKG